MAFFLSPINSQQFDANGKPLSGGKIYTYLAGSTTPVATYTSNTGATQQANPIILNTLGLPASPIWLQSGQAYKFVIQDSLGNTLETFDNISGINDASFTPDQWVLFAGTPTYVSGTSFTLAGDQTLTFQRNRRIKTTNTGGTIYSTITGSTYSAPNTTVTVVNDSGALDSGLSQVSYGLISVQNSSVAAGLLATGVKSVSVPYTLTSADAGQLIFASGTGNVTCPTNIFPQGVGCTISASSGTDNITLVPSIGVSFAYGGASKTSISLANNESVSLVCQGGSNAWAVFAGGLRSSDDFLNSAGTNGYQRLPSGILVQWGTASNAGSADSSVSFPLAFSSGCYAITGSITSNVTGYATAFSGLTTSGFNFGTWANNTTRGAASVFWMAIGK